MPVKSKEVQRVLNVTSKLLLQWHRDCQFYQVARHMYEIQHINAFLSRRARFYSSPPRWQEIHNETFLRAVDVERQFGIPVRRLERLTHSQQIPHLSLPGRAGRRYRAVHIQEVLARVTPSFVSLQYAAQLLGHANTLQVSHALESGNLQRAFVLEDQQHTYITHESFMALLRERLPAWVKPDLWVQIMEMQGQLLFTGEQAVIMLGLPVDAVRAELDRRKAQYIAFGDNERILVPYSWLVAQFPHEPTVDERALRRLFGATIADARRWAQNIAAVCPIDYHPHEHCPGVMWRSCWIEFLRQHCSPGYSFLVQALVRRRVDKRNTPRLLTVAQVARRLGCEERTVEFYAQAGVIHGYQTPDGQWRFEIDRLQHDVSG